MINSVEMFSRSFTFPSFIEIRCMIVTVVVAIIATIGNS